MVTEIRPGVFLVPSNTTAGVEYGLSYGWTKTGLMHLVCTCKAGQNRTRELVPCRHARAVGKFLLDAGRADYVSGFFYRVGDEPSRRVISGARCAMCNAHFAPAHPSGPAVLTGAGWVHRECRPR